MINLDPKDKFIIAVYSLLFVLFIILVYGITDAKSKPVDFSCTKTWTKEELEEKTSESSVDGLRKHSVQYADDLRDWFNNVYRKGKGTFRYPPGKRKALYAFTLRGFMVIGPNTTLAPGTEILNLLYDNGCVYAWPAPYKIWGEWLEYYKKNHSSSEKINWEYYEKEGNSG